MQGELQKNLINKSLLFFLIFEHNSIEYMREVIGFYKKVNGIIQNYLGKEQDIQEARDKGFQHFLNKFEKSIAYLARNCDYEMRLGRERDNGFDMLFFRDQSLLFSLGMKGNSEEEIEEKLQSVIDIFLCFHNRDSFIVQHQKLLAVRLLTGQSLSDETEKRLITLIKVTILMKVILCLLFLLKIHLVLVLFSPA